MKKNRLAPFAVLTAAAVLMLTGCTGQPLTPRGLQISGWSFLQLDPIYSFETAEFTQDRPTLITLQDSLIEAAGIAENRDITQLGLNPMDLRDPSHCAVELVIGYADETIPARLLEASDPVATVAFSIGLRLTDGKVHAEPFDEASYEYGAYVSEDLRFVTIVEPCAMRPDDTSHAAIVQLRYAPTITAELPIATVKITAMAKGNFGLVGQVHGYVQDSNGNWIAD